MDDGVRPWIADVLTAGALASLRPARFAGDAIEDRRVADLALEESEMRVRHIGEDRFTSEEEIVHHRHPVTALKQHADQQRSDVARAARDQNLWLETADRQW